MQTIDAFWYFWCNIKTKQTKPFTHNNIHFVPICVSFFKDNIHVQYQTPYTWEGEGRIAIRIHSQTECSNTCESKNWKSNNPDRKVVLKLKRKNIDGIINTLFFLKFKRRTLFSHVLFLSFSLPLSLASLLQLRYKLLRWCKQKLILDHN